MPVRIDRLDLKILKVLLVLAKTRNTYRAAEQLHLSQSAISRALGRLREALDDPVFIRSPGGLEPTALTERLVSRLPEVLDMLTDAVEEGAGFDPAQWTGSVSIALSSHVMHCWGQDIYRRLSAQAPLVTWNFHSWHSGSVKSILEGQLDLGMHFLNETWEQSLYQQTIIEDPFVLMVRKDHPALGQPAELSLFERYGLVSLLIPDWNDHGNVLELKLKALCITAPVSLRSESLAMALDCLKSSDCVMAGTKAMAAGQDDLSVLEYPPDLNTQNLPVVMGYPRRMRNSARYTWLTSTIKTVLTP